MAIPALGNMVGNFATGFVWGAIDAAFGLLITPQRSIGTVFPDVTLQEIGRDDMVVTDHPVEMGAPISDHAFKRPVAVELRYAWSNSTAGYVGYVQEVYEALLALQNSRQPFDISTGKRLYTNMLITSLTQYTDPENEYGLLVACECREVIIAETQTVKGVNQKDQKTPSATAGVQSTGPKQMKTTAAPPGFAYAGNS
ncbi:phage baseplate protein [Ochrobactrum chromiisoli]|uniref:Dit-like phage tail protein N-terminal domain-containing protein n=1 Tax=Ochrobactrum chromiisoli TaxID=2993941 RepID=A0ABT3QUF6_9HYPH|nr:hypothetical protein [Ochrobactrum chromiisoli]MCX2699261.1 hypothetical protein [Ochrobactrum chromiisoli]